ncbi:MAG: glycosyltransferase [Lutibacter sp.]|nr:glycosyltransferase [Lutibacter sp.]
MFQHYILTRFNLRATDWTTTKNKEKVLTEEWLKERFDLFENYCFSSVKNQSNQNFKWLVFFDVNTPEVYKLKVEKYKKSYENFYPFFIDGMPNFLPEIVRNIKMLDSKKYIITSRLDNDDSIHEDYVNVVQSYFNNQNHLAIDFIDGYTLQIGEKTRLGFQKHLYNPFISLIEKKEDFKTVWFRSRHGSWKYEKNIIRVKDKRLWLGIIHSKNKVNKFEGYGKVDEEIINKFHVTKIKRDEILNGILNYNSWRLLSFSNKLSSLSACYYKDFKKFIGLYK